MHNLFANPYEFLKKFCDTILLAPYNNTCLSAFHVVLQIGQKFSQPPAEDLFYSRTRSMLTSLGLQNYEKNFKRGLLTDSTLPLLTDRQVIGLPYSLCVCSPFFSYTCWYHDGFSFPMIITALLKMREFLLDQGSSFLITSRGLTDAPCTEFLSLDLSSYLTFDWIPIFRDPELKNARRL